MRARPSDQSFLESVLEAAIAQRLPGSASTSQGRRRFALEGFQPHPYGVDIEWRHGGLRTGIEVKVTDVLDSLFDVVKLATAVAHGEFDEAYCATAATVSQWARGGPFRDMATSPLGEWRAWRVQQLLAEAAPREAVLVPTGPRPYKVPSQIETTAGEPIEMARAPTHTLRVVAVRPGANCRWLRLPPIDVPPA